MAESSSTDQDGDKVDVLLVGGTDFLIILGVTSGWSYKTARYSVIVLVIKIYRFGDSFGFEDILKGHEVINESR